MSQLSAQKLIEPDAQFETLYGGRTNRVWKVLGGKGDTVLKLYRNDFRNPLFRNDARAEAACLTALKDTGFVPNLRSSGTYETVNWVLYDHAPGDPWRKDVTGVAHLLRQLHQIPGHIIEMAAPNGSDDLRDHGLRILDGSGAEDQTQLLRLKPATYVSPTPDTCLIHSDPVPGNILQSQKGLTLIDWQCPARGDACEDIAVFLSPAMQSLYRGAPLTRAEENRFLTAYEHPETIARYKKLRPWYLWRMAAYCLWRAARGSADYARGYELEIARLRSDF